jgi:hypothetical protein
MQTMETDFKTLGSKILLPNWGTIIPVITDIGQILSSTGFESEIQRPMDCPTYVN